MCDAQGKQCRSLGGSVVGEGITDADFVFYVSAMDTERCQKGMTVAYAAHCQQEVSLDRYSSLFLVLKQIFMWRDDGSVVQTEASPSLFPSVLFRSPSLPLHRHCYHANA